MRTLALCGLLAVTASACAGAGTEARPPSAPLARVAAATTATPTTSTASGPAPFPNVSWTNAGKASVARGPLVGPVAASGALDLYAGNGAVLAATTHGMYRSTDAGHSWHQVAGGVFWSVGYGPTGYFGLGGSYDGRVVDTVTSVDGIHWRHTYATLAVRNGHPPAGPAFGYQVAADGSILVAASRVNRFPDVAPTYRSTDGGHTWHRVRLPGFGGAGVQVLDNGAFVTATQGAAQSCRGVVYRSLDGGATFQELPRSCVGLTVNQVDFSNVDDGVAVGGYDTKFGGGQVIETTTDGGATWTVTHHVPNRQSYRGVREGYGGVSMVTPTSGFVFVGVCIDPLGGPCGGDLEWTTDDGRSLHRVPDPARAGWLAAVDLGRGRYVAAATGRNGHDAIGRSSDAGRHWLLQTSPKDINPNGLFNGDGATLVWHNGLGRFASTDHGRTWHHVTTSRYDRVLRTVGALAARPSEQAGCRATGRGREWWMLCAIEDSDHSWVLHSTDEGHHWVGHRMPAFLTEWATHVVPVRPNTAKLAVGGAIWRTRDGGATWRETWPVLPGEGRR